MTYHELLHFALLFTAIPAIAFVIGGIVGAFVTISEKISAAVQHFAAGVVFAAVAVELVPFLGTHLSPWVLAIGFLLGVFVMLGVKTLTTSLSSGNTKTLYPIPVLTAVGIDIFIDGILIGIALLAGKNGGALITLALAIEIFFLGLSTATIFSAKQIKVAIQLITYILTALLIPIGGVIAISVIAHLPRPYMLGFIAFGIAALLYLVTEELLVEAHEKIDTPLITACFFFGFLFILLLET